MLALFCCHFVVNIQGRNFGAKSRGTNSAGERGAFGSWGERGREWRASVPSSFDSGVWVSVVSSPSGSGWSAGRKRFNLRRSPLFTAGDSKFFTFSSRKVWYQGGATEGCEGQCPLTFGTSGPMKMIFLCFYSRQSLFSKVQVTEFQVSTPLTLVDTCQVNDIWKDGLGRVSTVHPHWTTALFKSTCQHAHAAVNWLSMSLSRPAYVY